MQRLWITWERQRRNHTISSELSIPLVVLESSQHWILRYVVLLIRTLIVVLRERPRMLVVQNPSLVLAFFAVNYGRLVDMAVVVDAHNAGLFPCEGRNRVLNVIAKSIIRRASLTIVTNENLKQYVERVGGRGHVFPDPLPNFPEGGKNRASTKQQYIVFICTYAPDEPYLEVIEAAKRLDRSIVTFITGSVQPHVRKQIGSLPDNVILTDYLPEEDYVSLLLGADLIIDLTTRDNCLVCGAYEAVAAGVPVILSDTPALRRYFHRGALFTDNSCADLQEKIQEGLTDNHALRVHIRELKQELLAHRDLMKSELEALLQDIVHL